MHRGLPGGNTKSVFNAIKALSPSDLGPGLRLPLRVLPSSGDIHRTPSCGSAPTSRASHSRIVHLAHLHEMQRCICMNAWIMQ